MRPKLLTLAVVASLGLFVSAFAQEKTEIKALPEPGTYVVETNMDMDMTTTMGGNAMQSIPSRNRIVTVMEMDVAPADAEGRRVYKTTYKRFAMTTDSQGMSMAYDSADPTKRSHPASNVLQNMIDQEVELTVSAEGELTDITGLEEMFEKMAQDTPELAASTDQMKQQMGEQMHNQLLVGSQMLPAEPVAKGETWELTTKQSMAMLGEMDINYKMTLRDIVGGVAIVDFEGTTDSAGGEDGPVPGAEMKRFKTQHTGSLRQDIETGITSELSINQDIDMLMSAGGNDMAIKGETKMTATTKPGEYQAPTNEAAPEE